MRKSNFFNFIMWFDMLSLDAELEVPEVVAIEMATSTLEERIREALLMQNPADPSALPDDESIRQMAEAEAPGFVAELVTQQLITPTETGYATDVAFRSGQLTMNDKPLSLMP